MGSMRRFFFLLVIFSVCGVVIILLYLTYNTKFSKLYDTRDSINENAFFVNSAGCRIPMWNPYDPSVMPFIKAVEGPYKCPGKPSFLNVKPNAVIHIDETVLYFYYGLTKSNISCSYQPIIREPGDEKSTTENKFTIGTAVSLKFEEPIENDFVIAKCSLRDLPLFLEYLPLVPIKPGVEMACNRAAQKAALEHSELKSERLNIIIVGIDSVSKLNFLRHFPKTYQFLKDTLNVTELHGYTKVGDNTFPNLVSLLTGRFVESYGNESEIRNMFFDNLNLIWKNFSELGYRTLLAEDAPYIAIFNYLKKGFRNPPTDYYLRPFALALENSRLKSQSKAYCVQSKMELEVYYDYLRSFVRTMNYRPFFALHFMSKLSHDYLNFAGYGDLPTFLLFEDLHQSGVLNRTVLLFMSDHGIRFGGIRQTYIGQVEERMPFMFLHFPKWFLKMHSQFATNLRRNQRRLTTPFDIHATLSHLLNVSHQSFNTMRGISLFTEIPKSRTCSDASISLHWCPCLVHSPVSLDNGMVLHAAEILIDTINSWTKEYRELCAFLKVNEVVDAKLSQPNEHFLQNADPGLTLENSIQQIPKVYLVIIRAFPSSAVFEGTVLFDDSHTFKVLDVSRINRYGNQSACISNFRLQNFCYCKQAFYGKATYPLPENVSHRRNTSKV